MSNPFGITELQQFAGQVHEMFEAYVNAGFTRDEALRLVIETIKDAKQNQPGSPS